MRIKILILLCALASEIFAQTVEETKTVFGNGKPHLGFFVSPTLQLGKIAGSTAILPGIGGGVILNHKFSVGLTYKFIASENTPAGEEDTRLYLDQFYAGLKFEYSIFPAKPVHVNIQLEGGVGHTELDLKESYENDHSGFPSNDASFGYLEPGLALEINLWKYLKLDIGAGYRFASEVLFRSITEKDLMGLSCFAGLKIGIF
jgi:hypothetical protein